MQLMEQRGFNTFCGEMTIMSCQKFDMG